MRTIALAALLFTACEVGTIPNRQDGAIIGDATADGTADMFDQTACVDRLTPSDQAHIHTDDGSTKVGQSCGTGVGCHATGSANPWLFSGTVYGADGTTPEAGVLVRIRTSDPSRPLRAVTTDAGNFHFLDNPGSGTQALLTFPTKVEVTACPDVTPMVAEVTDKAGLNCTNGTCHPTGMRIRLKLP